MKLSEPSPDALSYQVQGESVSANLGDLKTEAQDAYAIYVDIPAGKLSRGEYVLKLFRTNRDGTEHGVKGVTSSK